MAAGEKNGRFRGGNEKEIKLQYIPLIVLHRDIKPLENRWIKRLWYYARTIKTEVRKTLTKQILTAINYNFYYLAYFL